MTNEEIARFLSTAQPHIQGNPNLSDPEVEGWFRTRQDYVLHSQVRPGKQPAISEVSYEWFMVVREPIRND
ncbi:MAG: hypothetical protein ABSC19_05710 [Syntrophorhabdales bacterium]|jgi:hypothetical protein